MATGENAERNGHAGREYWSKRGAPVGMWGWCKFAKILTHRLERREGHRQEREALTGRNED